MAAEKVVLWNAGAGSAARGETAQRQLAQQPGTKVIVTHSAEDARQATLQALQAGIREILVAGGDGSINTIGEQIIRSGCHDAVLSILPIGTGNDLARELGIPLDPVEAVEMLSAAPVRKIDAIDVEFEGGRRVALNTFSAGNTGKYTQALTAEEKERWGAWCFVRGAIDVLQDLECYELTVQEQDGAPFQIEVLNLFLANGPGSGGGLMVAPPARLNDGLLDLVAICDGPPLDIAELAASYMLGDFLDHELVVHRRVTGLKLQSNRPLAGAIDGLELEGSRFSLQLLPGVLQVRCAPNAPALLPDRQEVSG